jgi:hypothetical protein
LPCANCHLYYSADLESCPICHHRERVSAVVSKARPKPLETLSPSAPDSATLEQQREEFLRQFNSRRMQAHTEVVSGQDSLCALSEHHDGEEASAEICKVCYERLHEQLENYEAALKIDLKEAAQVIYDAVWSDPSDPSKTYENAAAALLNELRQRAGMNPPPAPSD